MRIVAIINQKGGCGKTTTAINLAGVLSKSGVRTLLVDMDPQSHCAVGLGVPEHRIDLDIGDALVALGSRPIDPARLLWRVGRNLDLAPSRMKLAGLEASRGGLADKTDKERRLSGVLAQFSRDYDVALIDCSPAIGLLTFNALTAASGVLIPVETGFFSLQGAAKQVHTVTTVGRRLGVEVPLWLLPTIHDPSSGLAKDLLLEIRKRFGDKVAPVVIRRDDRLREAASFGQPIVEYAPESLGAEDYRSLGRWLCESLSLGSGSPLRERIPHADEPELDLSAVEEPGQVRVLVGRDSTTGLSHRIMGTPATPEFVGAAATLPPTEAFVIPEPEPKPAPEPDREAVHADPVDAAPTPIEEPRPLSRAEDVALLVARLGRRDLLTPGASAPAAPAATPETSRRLEPRPVLTLDTSAQDIEPKPPSRPVPVERLAGARVTRQGVLFAQPISVGGTVAVAGDFNGWSPDTHRLRRNEGAGIHELCVKLEPGRHVYRLVIDGSWTADPFNDEFELNPFGEPNSVVNVGNK